MKWGAQNGPSRNVRPEDSLSCELLHWLCQLSALWRQSILYGGEKTQLILRARGLMATLKEVMFADLHTQYFSKVLGQICHFWRHQEGEWASAGVCHLQGSISVTLWRSLGVICFSSLQRWLLVSNQFTLEESVEIQVPAGEEREGCISCLPGMAIVCAGVCRVWPGSCTLGSWWIRSSLGDAFPGACSHLSNLSLAQLQVTGTW